MHDLIPAAAAVYCAKQAPELERLVPQDTEEHVYLYVRGPRIMRGKWRKVNGKKKEGKRVEADCVLTPSPDASMQRIQRRCRGVCMWPLR